MNCFEQNTETKKLGAVKNNYRTEIGLPMVVVDRRPANRSVHEGSTLGDERVYLKKENVSLFFKYL